MLACGALHLKGPEGKMPYNDVYIYIYIICHHVNVYI